MTGGYAWPWIAAPAAMTGSGKRYVTAQMNTYPSQPMVPPLHRGTGAINRAPARYGRLGTRAGGGAATLLLHSSGGDTLGGCRPPGGATGRSRGTINRAVGVMNDAPTQDPNGVLIRH